MSAYDEQMRDLINMTFETIDYSYEKYYIFLVNESNCGCIKGFMPQNRQVGFVVTSPHNNTNDLTRTIAHELGHGVFNLNHTYADYPSLSVGSTDNLMDKGNGTKLHKYQWDLIQNPAFNITLFDDDEDGASEYFSGPKIVITTTITGYTIQRIPGGYENYYIVIPVYHARLVDNNNPSVMIDYINVTRDAWYLRGIDSMGVLKLTNRAFEPRLADRNLYTGTPLEYPNHQPNPTDIPAWRLTQRGDFRLQADPHLETQNTRLNGSPINDARDDLAIASEVMFHIGGRYQHTPHEFISVAASYGCFGGVSSNQVFAEPEHAQSVIDNGIFNQWTVSNAEYREFTQQVVDMYFQNPSVNRVLIEIKKRENYDRFKDFSE